MAKEHIIQLYDSELHEYTIVLKTKDGQFVGKSICAPEDYKYESSLTGFTIAEARAQISHIKYIIKQKKEELKVIKHFYNSLKCYSEFDDTSKDAKKIRRLIYTKERDIKALKDNISYREDNIEVYINDCLTTAKRLSRVSKEK